MQYAGMKLISETVVPFKQQLRLETVVSFKQQLRLSDFCLLRVHCT